MSKAVDNRLSFGRDATAYLRYRPRYPRALFEHLAAVAPSTGAALDCATGNGQAAVGLAEQFRRVTAFDPSPEQIAAALPAANLAYVVATAEALPFQDGSFDLVTAAQGAHWFDLERFFAGLRLVARPGAIIAIWGYSHARIDPAVDRIVERELLGAIAPYWAAGNKVIVEQYRGIPFPFEELAWPLFVSSQDWYLREFLFYLGTLSAVKRFAAEAGTDPLPGLERALAPVWPSTERRNVSFDLVGRIGRIYA